MLYNALVAAIRTGIAAAVGFVIAWAVAQGVTFPEGFEEILTAGLFAGTTVAYNALVNWLTLKVHPFFGYLLGVPKTPEYLAVAAQLPDGQVVATDLSPIKTGELVYVAPVQPHDPALVDNREPHPYEPEA